MTLLWFRMNRSLHFLRSEIKDTFSEQQTSSIFLIKFYSHIIDYNYFELIILNRKSSIVARLKNLELASTDSLSLFKLKITSDLRVKKLNSLQKSDGSQKRSFLTPKKDYRCMTLDLDSVEHISVFAIL